MTVLKVKDADGNWRHIPAIKGKDGADGADGKSAYEYAVEAGYGGTEEKFAFRLANESMMIPVTVDENGGYSSEVSPLTVYEMLQYGISMYAFCSDEVFGDSAIMLPYEGCVTTGFCQKIVFGAFDGEIYRAVKFVSEDTPSNSTEYIEVIKKDLSDKQWVEELIDEAIGTALEGDY